MSNIYHFTKSDGAGVAHAAVDGSGTIGMGISKQAAVKCLEETPIYVGQAIFSMFDDWKVELKADESKPFFLRQS